MSGANFKLYGILLAIIGAGILAYDYNAVNAGYQSAVWMKQAGLGTLVVAFGLFILGLFSTFVKITREPSGTLEEDVKISMAAMLRCMVAVSIADNHLDDSEVQMIARIYKQLVGVAMPEETIRETAEYMIQDGVNLHDELQNIRDRTNKDLRDKIVKASLYILAADGEMDRQEEKRLEEIRAGLEMSQTRYNKIKKEFLSSKGLAA